MTKIWGIGLPGGLPPPRPPGGPANCLPWGTLAPQTPRGSRDEPGQEWEQQPPGREAPRGGAAEGGARCCFHPRPPGGSGGREPPRKADFSAPPGGLGGGSPPGRPISQSMLPVIPVARYFRPAFKILEDVRHEIVNSTTFQRRVRPNVCKGLEIIGKIRVELANGTAFQRSVRPNV